MADFDTQRKKRMEALEEKKKRLEEMRKMKQERETVPIVVKEPVVSTARNEVNDLVNSLLSQAPAPTQPSQPVHGEDSSQQTPQIEKPDMAKAIIKDERRAKLSVVRGIASLHIASSIPETYDKSCQTEDVEVYASLDDGQNFFTSSASQKLQHHRPPTQKQTQKGAESVIPPLTVSATEMSESGAMQGLSPAGNTSTSDMTHKSLSADEKEAILKSESFLKFLDNSSHVIERALGQVNVFDLLRDYRSDDAASKASLENRSLFLSTVFEDDSVKGRPVMDVKFSPHFPELFLVAYGSKIASSVSKLGTSSRGVASSPRSILEDEPAGLVCIWSMGLPTKPEFKFSASSPVLSGCFHDQEKHLVIGGCQTGQILLWDMRAKGSPVQRSSLTGKGHKHPVYTVCMLYATASPSDLVTISTDGTLCHWDVSRLNEPNTVTALQEYVSSPWSHISAAGSALVGGLSDQSASSLPLNISTMTFSSSEALGAHDVVVLGSGVGQIFRGGLPLRKEERMLQIAGHRGLVTSMQVNPSQHKVFSKLLLTSSLDWTVKLWNVSSWNSSSSSSSSSAAASSKPIFEFFSSSYDYISDVQWCPTHPAVFSTITSGGTLALWDLMKNTSEPLEIIRIARDASEEKEAVAGCALNKSAWSRDGRTVLVGDARGGVHMIAVKDGVTKFATADASRFEMVVLSSRDLSSVQSALGKGDKLEAEREIADEGSGGDGLSIGADASDL